MKLAVGWFSLALAIFFAPIVQEFIPKVTLFEGARVLLVPMLFCYGALAMPLWAMVLMAAYTGFLTDLWYMQFVNGQVEIALGWSIFYFVFFGLLAHGFQTAFLRGQWWLHIVLSAVGTSTFLALQYVMICFRRQEFLFDEKVAWLIIGPGLMAAVLSPLLHLVVSQTAQFFPVERHPVGGYRMR